MPRKSALDESGVGQEAITLALSGQSHGQIAETLNAKHGLKLDRYSVGHYLRRNTAQIVPLKEIATQAKADTLTFTLDNLRRILGDIYNEVQGKIDTFEGRPRDFASFLRVKLDLIDKTAKLSGIYQDGTRINILNAPGQPPDGKTGRCFDCPLKDKFSREELRKVLLEGEEHVFPERKLSTSDKADESPMDQP